MTTVLTVIGLIGWGLLVTAIAVRAFGRLRIRAKGMADLRAGFLRLMLGVASFLVLAEGGRAIATVSHGDSGLILVPLFASAVHLAYLGLRNARRRAAGVERRTTRDLVRALGVQFALLPLYAFYALIGLATSTGAPAWVAFALLGSLWLLVAVLLLTWWWEGRRELVQRAFAWGGLIWLTVLVPVLFAWVGARRLLVPPPPNCLVS